MRQNSFRALGLGLALAVSGGLVAQEMIVYSGSSTIGMAVLEAGGKQAFNDLGGVKLGLVGQPGTGKGVAQLIEGKVDIAGASRKLKAEESTEGVVGHVIGYDGIGVFVHASNPIVELSKEQLKGIFTGRIRSWSEVGGRDEPITPTTERLDSKRATLAVVQELLLDGEPYGRGIRELGYSRDQLVHLYTDRTGICAVSLGLVDVISPKARNAIKTVRIGGLAPTQAKIVDESYLLARPLILATRGEARGGALELIEFMKSAAGQAIVGKSFVPVGAVGVAASDQEQR